MWRGGLEGGRWVRGFPDVSEEVGKIGKEKEAKGDDEYGEEDDEKRVDGSLCVSVGLVAHFFNVGAGASGPLLLDVGG